MDSGLIEEMALELPNLCGVKLTCGDVGKLTRIAATVAEPSFDKEHPRKVPNAPYVPPSSSIIACTQHRLLPDT
jgi:4-hydroxy-2-oxoglutarate aldolase